MGLLAPLYALGVLAIALPILFHLIRRQPQGKQTFSSLMFLVASPPRISKRSRLNHILLLILRSAAILLLAFAFARPFLNNLLASEMSSAQGRKIAILVDCSASMSRSDLWKQAQARADEILKTVTPADQVALFLFDDRVHNAFGFDEWKQTAAGERAALLADRLKRASPTHAGTKLGDAVTNVADQLSEIDPSSPEAEKMPRILELISDMQKGGDSQTLQGHQWPAKVALDVRPVALADAAKAKNNASLEWVKQTAEDEDAGDDKLRVRVSNQAGSRVDQFTLAWADASGPIPGADPVNVYVPPGHGQIVRIAWPEVPERNAGAASAAPGATRPSATRAATNAATKPATQPDALAQAASTRMAPPPPPPRTADRLVLSGDDFDFDNTLYIVPPRTDVFSVMYIGNDPANNVEGLQYYLQSALADSPRRRVTLLSRGADHPPTDADFSGLRLAVVGMHVDEATAALLQHYMESGGNVLWILGDAQGAPELGRLLGVDGLQAKEASGDFSLISRVDTNHPLFSAFADAQYADFTKIHFWHHRKLDLPGANDATGGGAEKMGGDGAAGNGISVLAWFDDGSPFVLEKGIGRGWLRALTSGWNPDDSQFALSTKFVPVMEGLLKRRDEVAVESQYLVHDTIALPPAVGTAGSGARVLVLPGEKAEVGKRMDLPAAATVFEGTDAPGIYHLLVNGQDVPLAVNLSPEESDLEPLTADDLAQWGAKLGTAAPTEADKLAERRRSSEELEKRQKIWRWIILCVLGLLGAETLLAGRMARRAFRQEATT